MQAEVDVQQKPVPSAVFGDAKKLLEKEKAAAGGGGGGASAKGALELLKNKKRRLN